MFVISNNIIAVTQGYDNTMIVYQAYDCVSRAFHMWVLATYA